MAIDHDDHEPMCLPSLTERTHQDLFCTLDETSCDFKVALNPGHLHDDPCGALHPTCTAEPVEHALCGADPEYLSAMCSAITDIDAYQHCIIDQHELCESKSGTGCAAPCRLMAQCIHNNDYCNTQCNHAIVEDGHGHISLCGPYEFKCRLIGVHIIENCVSLDIASSLDHYCLEIDGKFQGLCWFNTGAFLILLFVMMLKKLVNRKVNTMKQGASHRLVIATWRSSRCISVFHHLANGMMFGASIMYSLRLAYDYSDSAEWSFPHANMSPVWFMLCICFTVVYVALLRSQDKPKPKTETGTTHGESLALLMCNSISWAGISSLSRSREMWCWNTVSLLVMMSHLLYLPRSLTRAKLRGIISVLAVPSYPITTVIFGAVLNYSSPTSIAIVLTLLAAIQCATSLQQIHIGDKIVFLGFLVGVVIAIAISMSLYIPSQAFFDNAIHSLAFHSHEH